MGRRVTVAVDVLGGDAAPAAVIEAMRLLDGPADPSLLLVGPEDLVPALLAFRGLDPGAVEVLHAPAAVPMDGHPLDAVRQDAQAAHPRLSVTVAAQAVRDGRADAWVSAGHTGAAVAAAVLCAGRIPGIGRPALAVVLPALEHPVVLLDAGASPDASSQALAQFAVAGWCYARALGIEDPVVGLLTIGSEPGKGDDLRREAEQVLAERLQAQGIPFAGPVEGDDVVTGRRAQVVVTDGFTGNVLLKGLEGAVQWSAARMGEAYGNATPAWDVVLETATSDFAGGMLLGVDGVTVIGHGAGSAAEVCACVRLAARAAAQELAPRTNAAFLVRSTS